MVGLNTSKIHFGNATAQPEALAATPVAATSLDVVDKLAPASLDTFTRPQAFQMEEAAPAAAGLAPEKEKKSGHPILKTLAFIGVVVGARYATKRFAPSVFEKTFAKVEKFAVETFNNLKAKFKKTDAASTGTEAGKTVAEAGQEIAEAGKEVAGAAI